jgi:hypothetical protein
MCTDNIDATYKNTIDTSAENKKDLVIHNGDINHASYLLYTFFKYAKKKICIFTGGLNEKMYCGGLIEEAVNFLTRNPEATIEIAFQNCSSKNEIINRSLVRTILDNDEIQDRLTLYMANDSEYINHFAIMDNKAYRLEIDQEKKQAIANFGDADRTSALHAIFQSIVANHQPVILTA